MLILFVSIYPGQPAHALFGARFLALLLIMPPLGLLTIPIVGWGIWQSRQWLFSSRRCSKWVAIATPIFVSITSSLVYFNIPQPLAFRLSQNAFQQALQDVPSSATQTNIRIGLYKVDRYGTDPRGGIYFRIRGEEAGLDLVHHGFVYRPNPQGSPFGQTRYTLKHLAGDWYIFSDASPFSL